MQKAIKNYKLLKTSWRYQTREYFDNSTLHGVRYIAEDGRPFREKFMWFCFVSAGAVATMVIISSLWEKFQTNPTITGLDTDFHNFDIPFPAITICEEDPTNPSYVDTFIDQRWSNISQSERDYFAMFLKKLTSLSYNTITEFKNFTGDRNLPNDNLRDIVFEVVSHCEDFMHHCTFRGLDYDCCQGFFPVFTENGFCYIFNSRHSETYWPWLRKKLPEFEVKGIEESDTSWLLGIDSKNLENPFDVYINSHNEVPGQDVRPQHRWTRQVERILFSVKHTYTTEDARLLSIRQRRCAFDDEIHLKIDSTYTYFSCTRQCRMEAARKFCNCVPFFYPEIKDFRYCTLEELSCIADHAEKIISLANCHCELSCTNTVYEVEKFIEFELLKLLECNTTDYGCGLQTEFVSWPMVRYKREVIFGWVDLVVSFGGIAGLFLGFSLLSGVEILYYFFVRACCMVRRQRGDLLRMLRDNERRRQYIPNYDLSLVPYIGRRPEPGQGLRTLQSVLGVKHTQIEPIQVQPVQPYTIRAPKKAWSPEQFPFGVEYLP